MSKNLLLEIFLINQYRDKSITPNSLRQKYKNLNLDISKIYREIVNYQIKKYGVSLNVQ